MAGSVVWLTPFRPDDLWVIVDPMLSAAPPGTKVGRPLVPARLPDGYPLCPHERHSLGDAAAGAGLWLLRDLLAPSARLAGVWMRVHQTLLDRLGERDRIDGSPDSASVPAQRRATPWERRLRGPGLLREVVPTRPWHHSVRLAPRRP